GYSALMSADEEATVRDLKAHQAVLLPMIGERGGRIIDTAGDGILAEFQSIVNAVKCALAIQRVMTEPNARVEPARPMQSRIGLNLGDVTYAEARVSGDGINIAARLEGIAEPGGICVSGKVYDEVRGKFEQLWQFLGERELKHIAEPVRVYVPVIDAKAAAPQAEGPAASAPKAAALRRRGGLLKWLLGRGRGKNGTPSPPPVPAAPP